MKTIFKVGDKVYHINFGWGEVKSINNGNYYPLIVKFNNLVNEASFTFDGKILESQASALSFTEYDFVNGGFSQERPQPEIEDIDIATVEALHDLLLDAHGYSLDFTLLKNARRLTEKMYKLLK